MAKKVYRVSTGSQFQSVVASNREQAIKRFSKNMGIPQSKVKSARKMKR